MIVLQSQPSWLEVQAQVYDELASLPKLFEQLLAEGKTGEQALSEVTLQGFIIQARNYLDLVSDKATLVAYMALLARIAQGELRKVARREHRTDKPEGMTHEVWEFITSREPALGRVVFDPLGAEIVWLESDLQQLVTTWERKAHRHAADRGLSKTEPTIEANRAAGVQAERKLTASQQQQIDHVEREFNEMLQAHENMREIVEPSEWNSLGPEPYGPTLAGEIKKLDRDIKKAAIKVVQVLAEAAWSLGSVERFRAQIQADATETLAWILAKVNKKDLPLLDEAAIKGAIAAETSNLVLEAQRVFPPTWKTSGMPAANSPGLRAADQVQATRSPEPEGELPHRTDGEVPKRRSPKEFVDTARRSPKRSYEKLAAHISISKDTLYAITMETRWISDENYKAVADACRCRPEDLHPRDIARPERRRR